MSPTLTMPRRARARAGLSRALMLVGAVALAGLLAPRGAQALDLADAPLFSSVTVPGNLALTLSVEWPTATTPAYPSTVAYSSASAYLGYFDPDKCYVYKAVNSGTAAAPNYATSYFQPESAATSRGCTSTLAQPRWSGNYLNWSSMQTLDAFRWVLTGGYRSVDTPTTTVLTKTYAVTNSSVMPHKSLSGGIAAATPFSYGAMATKLRALGVQMHFSAAAAIECSFSTTAAGTTTFTCWTSQGNRSCAANGTNTCTVAVAEAAYLSCSRSGTGPYGYSCDSKDAGGVTGSQCSVTNVAVVAGGTTTASCAPATTGSYAVVDYTGQSAAAASQAPNRIYRVYVNVRVCDGSVGLESNCTGYSESAKPEGLMQKYASRLRYSAFGYYNHSGSGRDGGVMRARMKHIGPQRPVPGSTAVANAASEWDATTGVMLQNPDPADATATVALAASAGRTVSISHSGVMNYLNKFGYAAKGYKSQDPVGELYYAALRYFKNLGNVPEYSSLASATSDGTAAAWLDGFPAVSQWDDPIAYSCQRNFVLGLGDVNTWNDVNLPGTALRSGTTNEPTLPEAVRTDTTVDVAQATAMVGKLEGFSGDLSTYFVGPNSATCSGLDQQCAGYLMAGLAYDSHVRDIRKDLTGTQTVSTYFMDVLENQVFRHKNQYWLASKYGGFSVPPGFDPYATSNSATTLPVSAWYTNTDTLPIGTNGLAFSTDTAGSDKRPDNYFPGNRPELMLAGLSAAFSKIVSETADASSTAFATASPNVATSGTTSYSAEYRPTHWTGTLSAATLSYAADGAVTSAKRWEAGALLDADTVTPSTRRIITCCSAGGSALPFTVAALGAGGLHARTNYASFGAVPGASSQSASKYLAYLRGDRQQELVRGGAYRTRGSRLGDIVNSKPLVVAVPEALYYDVHNPGYSDFRRTHAARRPVVYVGANDGMLHAFEGSVGTSKSGQELFAYVPSFAYGEGSSAATSGLASLGNPNFGHHYFVDGPLASFDVDFARTPGRSGGPDWRSLVIGGLGKGGKGYFAFDATLQDALPTASEADIASKLLWEFSDSRMGYSYSRPELVKTRKYGWVAMLPSGYGNADGKGYVFFVNPRTGALLEAVATPEGSLNEPVNLGHLSAYVEDFTDFTADAVYASDLRGNVWRIDLGSEAGSYPAPVKLAQLADAGGTLQPITTRPLIEIDEATGARYVLVGTGQLLSESDILAAQTQTLYVLRDGKAGSGAFEGGPVHGATRSLLLRRADLVANTDLLAGVDNELARTRGWYHDLPGKSGIGERINVQPVSNGTTVVFASNWPNGKPCEPGGTGSVYAVDFGTGRSVLENASEQLIASNNALQGVITDFAIQRVGGKLRIYAGSSSGEVANVRARLTGAGAARILNWRELPGLN